MEKNVENRLPLEGFVRLHQIIGRPASDKHPACPAIIPIKKTAWYAGIAAKRYPAPVRMFGRVACWDVADIRALIESASAAKAA